MQHVATRDAAIKKAWAVLRSNIDPAVRVDDCTYPNRYYDYQSISIIIKSLLKLKRPWNTAPENTKVVIFSDYGSKHAIHS